MQVRSCSTVVHVLTRREVCKATGAALAVLGAAPAASAVAAPTKAAGEQSLPAAAAGDALQLWYREPANEWVQALPVGNGRLGAMVWGGIAHERLQLNEDTLYAGGPYDATSPDALAALPQVRALIFAGRYAEAEALADAKMLSRPLKQMPYQPLGDLLLDFDRADGISEYRRQLDLDTGVVTTTFRSGGAVHKREVFVSAQSQCIVVRLSCDRPVRFPCAWASTARRPARSRWSRAACCSAVATAASPASTASCALRCACCRRSRAARSAICVTACASRAPMKWCCCSLPPPATNALMPSMAIRSR